MIHSRNLLYSVAAYLLVPWALTHLLLRGMRYAPYLRRWPERFGFVPKLDGANTIWIHAVSVGEVRTIIRLVKHIQTRFPDRQVLITTMTPTGSAQVKQCLGDSVLHFYVPFDLPGSVRRFLDRVRPAVAVIVETEFWPNIFRLCNERAIPLLLVNVRVSSRSFKGYRRFPRFTRTMLSRVAAMAVQSDRDAERLLELGAPADVVKITGNLKFDALLPPNLVEESKTLRRQWGESRAVYIAASTHRSEEKKLLRSFSELRKWHPDTLLVLVPRHPERFAQVARLCKRAGFQVALRSDTQGQLAPETDIVVGDTMGELPRLYAAADIAFIGGSLIPHGGQNIVEAMAAGVPIVFGPHMFNFEQSSSLAVSNGAGCQIESVAQLSATLRKYLDDDTLRKQAANAAKSIIENNRGSFQATQQLVDATIEEYESQSVVQDPSSTVLASSTSG